MDFKTYCKKHPIKLQEQFYNGVHVKGIGYTEIYKNPTTSELKDIRKDSIWEGKEQYFRIGIDNDFNLYAWKVEALHDDVEKKLDIKFAAKFTVRDKSAIYSETVKGIDSDWIDENEDKLEKTIQKYFPEVTIL